VLVHGLFAGGSSYEFRALFPLLARHRKVIAFDFIGCGLSDMPALEYTNDLLSDQLIDVLGAFTDVPATLAGSGLGAAIAIRVAARVPERVAALAAICPTGLRGVYDGPPPAAAGALGPIMRSPVAGETLYNAMVSKRALRRHLRTDVYARDDVAPEIVERYYAVTHLPGARYIAAALASGALNCNVARDLPFVEAPVLVVWGDRAPAANSWTNAPEYVRLAKRARLITVPGAGLLPHEDAPDVVADALLAPHVADYDSAPSPY
jgi:pimeloyl-ACP methyl ester carboxylesterase